MKNAVIAVCLGACITAFVGGCSTDEYARSFLARDTTAGKLDYAFLGDHPDLDSTHRIGGSFSW